MTGIFLPPGDISAHQSQPERSVSLLNLTVLQQTEPVLPVRRSSRTAAAMEASPRDGRLQSTGGQSSGQTHPVLPAQSSDHSAAAIEASPRGGESSSNDGQPQVGNREAQRCLPPSGQLSSKRSQS